MVRNILLSLIILSFTLPGLYQYGATLKDVTMSDAIEIDGQKLVLNGMALRKKFVFKVYVAGLYVPQKEKNGEKILKNDTPRHMVMHFLRDVEAEKINSAWLEGLEDNTPNASQELKGQFKTLCSWMEEIKDGNEIIFTYLPGKGTTVTVNGKNKGILVSKAFADALFACWIGPEPGPGESFKEDLLGIE